MKHLRKYNETFSESSIDINDIKDIFIDLRENNLEIDDVLLGIMKSDITTGKSIRSFSIRLCTIDSHGFEFKITDSLFDNLKNGIGHIESLYKVRLNHLQVRCIKQYWFYSVDTFEEALKSKYAGMNRYGFVMDQFISSLIYIDLVFEI